MFKKRFAVSIFTVIATFLSASGVSGQNFPNRPIRIVTSEVGGGNDVLVRIIAPSLTVSMGQPVIIENRASYVAVNVAVNASPDGYTVLLAGTFPNWIVSILRDDPNERNMVRDFSPIAIVARLPQVLVVHPSLPAKSVKELIALAKAKPGALNYGSSSIGGTNHLAGELFKALAGVNIVAVPYKGTGGGIIGLLANEVQLMIPSASSVVPHVKSGKLRALAVTSAQPSEFFPGLPTMAASGLPGYEMEQTLGMFAPRKTPLGIINRLNEAVVRVVSQADIREKFFNAGAETVGSSPAGLAAKVKTEMVRWGKVIKDAGIKGE